MKWSEFSELENCDQCPLKEAEICPGGYTSDYCGEPLEPPCCSFDDDTDLDEWVARHFEYERRCEEREDKQIREKAARDAKNKRAQELRNQAKRHVWIETHEIKRKRKAIAANEGAMHFTLSFAEAFNFANEAFGYSERVESKTKNPLEIENERLRQEIAELEAVKKRKLKELRESRKVGVK